MRLRDQVENIWFTLSKHCGDPTQQFFLHLADMVGIRDPEVSAGQFVFKRVVNSGIDLQGLYREFVTSLWSRYSWCVGRERDVPDPLGALLRRVSGDKYHTPEFELSPTDVIHEANKKMFPPEERTSGYHHGLKMFLELKPENVLPVLDPTCGTGRVGMNLVAYYPAASMWNIERDLETYRVALLNGKLLMPFTVNPSSGRSRWNTLWADSLIVNHRDERNWQLGANCWTPPDWRTTYTTAQGKTWADLQRDVGENHAFELVVENSMERA